MHNSPDNVYSDDLTTPKHTKRRAHWAICNALYSVPRTEITSHNVSPIFMILSCRYNIMFVFYFFHRQLLLITQVVLFITLPEITTVVFLPFLLSP